MRRAACDVERAAGVEGPRSKPIAWRVAAEVMVEEGKADARQLHRWRVAWAAYGAVNRLSEDYVQRLSG